MASPAPSANQSIQEVPLPIVGGTKFGRYSKISSEATWNFIISDNWLVPYAGYKNVLTIDPAEPGRGIYSSSTGDFMITVIGRGVYKIVVDISGNLVATGIGSLSTGSGDVYIAENNNGEICITDNVYVYVYNYLVGSTPELLSSNPSTLNNFSFPFDSPGYISFQNGRLIIACSSTTNWVLSGFNAATSWSTSANSVGSFQIKPDTCQACVPMPGGGNNLLVFGRNATEMWQDVQSQSLFPYQRMSTFNIDFGTINPASIAHLKNYVVWLSVNEASGPVLMVSYGGVPEAISTDGIDFQMGNLTDPENCTGFLYQQDGHTLYQFTFPTDNVSYAYDLDTKMFFNVSDEDLNYHIAREIVYFNNTYYFVSLNGGNIYDFNTIYPFAQYSDTDIRVIPRIRICPPLRMPDQRMYIAKSLSFTIENGQPNTFITTTIPGPEDGILIATESGKDITTEDGTFIATEADFATPTVYVQAINQVNLAVSRDGGETFGSFWTQDMNRTGNFKSRFIYQRLGQANDMTYQLRFNGLSRFVVMSGIVEIYK